MVSHSYVWAFVFLLLGDRDSYVWWLRILTFEGLGFLRSVVRDSYVWGLGIPTFGG